MKRRGISFWVRIILVEVVLSVVLFYIAGFFLVDTSTKRPDQLLAEYMEHIPLKEYKEMYKMIDVQASGYTSQEYFIKRNSDIYQGIGMKNMKLDIISYNKEQMSVKYRMAFDTDAGNISFTNNAVFTRNKDGY